MNKEEVVSAAVMTIVSAMVLIGITVAWYTITSSPTVTGLQLLAAEPGTIKIALQSESEAKNEGKDTSEDVSELAKNGIYADISIDELENICAEYSGLTDEQAKGKQKGQMAPGVFGKVTFYLTPTDKSIAECDIFPVVAIKQNSTYTEYYGDDEPETSAVSVDDSDGYSLEELLALTNGHIEFFSDAAMTQKIDTTVPMNIKWAENELTAEKQVDIYWKWHYEYPFTDNDSDLTEEQRAEKVLMYDKEDAVIGNNISEMRFHFKFGIK